MSFPQIDRECHGTFNAVKLREQMPQKQEPETLNVGVLGKRTKETFIDMVLRDSSNSTVLHENKRQKLY